MLKENRNNLAGLSGMKVEVYYDPDDLDAGAWAMDPRSGQSIYLTPENRIHPFNTEALSEEIAKKRRTIKAVSAAYRDTVAPVGKVLTATTYKPRIEAQAAAEKAVADKTAKAASLTDDDFNAAVAVASRLVRDRSEQAKRQVVYATPMKRYQAILDALIRGEDLSPADRLYRADYENKMGDIEKNRWKIYIDFNQGVKHGSQ
jgi:hypothetical protein